MRRRDSCALFLKNVNCYGNCRVKSAKDYLSIVIRLLVAGFVHAMMCKIESVRQYPE